MEYRGSLKVFVATLIHSRNIVISYVMSHGEISFVLFFSSDPQSNICYPMSFKFMLAEQF